MEDPPKGRQESTRCKSQVGERFRRKSVGEAIEQGDRNEAAGVRSSPEPNPGSEHMADKIPVWLDVDTGK